MKTIYILLILSMSLLLSGCNQLCNGVSYNPDTAICVRQCSNMVALFGDGCYDKYIITKEQIQINENISKENYIAAEKQYKLEQENYKNGIYYNYTFDIIKNYNISCKQIAYINDHLIDKSRQVDGGYITGHYSGVFSTGYVEGHLYDYITEGVLATGNLVEHIEYNLDLDNRTTKPLYLYACGNEFHMNSYTDTYNPPCTSFTITNEDTKKIDYYTESEFIMYYVRNCIGG